MFTAKGDLALMKSDKGGYGKTNISFDYIDLYQWTSLLKKTFEPATKGDLALMKSDKGGYGKTDISFGYIDLYQWTSLLKKTFEPATKGDLALMKSDKGGYDIQGSIFINFHQSVSQLNGSLAFEGGK